MVVRQKMSHFLGLPAKPEHWAKPYISQAVLLCLVVLFISAGSALLGCSIVSYRSIDTCSDATSTDCACPSGKETDCDRYHGDAASSTRHNAAIYSVLSQAILQLLAIYCTVVPVLNDYLSSKDARKLNVNFRVFFVSVIVSTTAAIAAPLTFGAIPAEPQGEMASAILAFASSVFSIITATQLASGVLKLDRKSSNR
ncbi:hypothetical protein JX265_004644 [Neoarthrinium moseri]|uniref:Uncharacterized protein n=1 Tax=Neoarthrinium moseri TaxID=1658444 RepID=A0A9Q0ARW8_9PEZI|nr:hypothetical protein JX265_004644 [Neoarthrinium moseri]